MEKSSHEHWEPADEELDRIYNHLQAGEVGGDVDDLDPLIVRAKAAVQLIQRVRDREGEETVRANQTLVENWCQLDNPSESPQAIGRFQIKQILGKGGFGIVFLAHDPNLGRDVALKIPRPEAVFTSELKARFLREGRAVASLAHPGIVPVYESGQIGAVCYLASQFVEGQTLAELSTSVVAGESEPPSCRTAAAIAAAIAGAIEHAHQRGVLHRDIKPANVLVACDSLDSPDSQSVPIAKRIQITDFGLAKATTSDGLQTNTGALIGTPSYMSPEQALQHPAEPASDIYSIGCVLYELLTGQPPFDEGGILSTIKAVVSQEPVSPRKANSFVPRDLEAICLKCLEKEPAKRYATAFLLTEDLSRFLDSKPVRARPVSRMEYGRRWLARNPVVGMLTGLAVALTLALVVGLSIAAILLSNANQKANRLVQLSQRTLFDSKISEARAIRLANGPARKQLATDALRFATQLSQEAQPTRRELDALRAEAAASAVQFEVDESSSQSIEPWDGKLSHRIAADKNGARYAVREQDGVVRVRSLATGQAVLEVSGYELAAWDPRFFFSSDGNKLAIIGSRQLPSAGKSRPRTEADNQVLGDQMTVEIWELDGRSGHRQLLLRSIHYKDEFSFSNAGKFAVLVQVSEGLMECFDLEKGVVAKTIKLPTRPWKFWLSPDGKQVAMVPSNDKERMMILDLASQRVVFDRRYRQEVQMAACWFGDSSKFMYLVGRTGMILRRVTEGAKVHFESTGQSPEIGGEVNLMEISPDGKWCLIAFKDGGTEFYRTGLAAHFEKVYQTQGSGLGFSNDSLSVVFTKNGNTIGKWGLSLPTGYRAVKDRSGPVTSLAFFEDDRFVVSTNGGNKMNLVHVRNLNRMTERMTFECNATRILTGCDNQIVTCGESREFKVWKKVKSKMNLLGFQEIDRELNAKLTNVAGFSVSGDRSLFSVTQRKGLAMRKFDAESWGRAAISGSSERHSLNGDGSLVATVNTWDLENKLIEVFQTANGKKVFEIKIPDAKTPQFSPDGNYLALLGNHDAAMYETKTWRLVWQNENLSSKLHAAAFRSDSKQIAILNETDISIVHTDTGNERFLLTPWKAGQPMSVAFAGSKDIVVMGDDQGVIHLWDLKELSRGMRALGLPGSGE